ncbi:biliverdin-producing heme oxygenase [Trujillonella endophytica]|uniref:Heme oxygenase n=1 Tax=Trujillonella endophytica TaxID=673521 RepID=A0A1H8UMT8_9ACTN|nr:biliverdin-producing heme oxygenase [Trujillella endophytica]SEP04540.1 Heme oxygenase [Trujillella endophytica]
MPRESGGADVLTVLRSATAPEHERVEEILGLVDPELTRERLAVVLTLMLGFWLAAEEGLDAWAEREPAAAEALTWSRRRRAGLFAADLATLGHADGLPARPELPPVADTDAALGRMYVLEGSTLGGTFIDRHLATLPDLSGGVRLRAFSPYGPDTGPMWQAFRRAVRGHVAGGGDADRVVGAARGTFTVLADWCSAARTADGA